MAEGGEVSHRRLEDAAAGVEGAALALPNLGSRDIDLSAFTADVDPDETGRRWQKWRRQLVTRFRYFRITDTQDKVDAIQIYGGELLGELIETVTNRPPQEGPRNEFEEILAKLDHYFTPMVNSDGARSKLEKMAQREGESLAQYYVRIRMQAAKCNFADIDDAIWSKLLQTMRDGKLRREAMTKRYTLAQLLEHTANKEDIDRQAQTMENANEVKRVYVKNRYPPAPKGRDKPMTPVGDSSNTQAQCQYCGFKHGGPRSSCPASGKTCAVCSKKGHFARQCKSNEANKKQQHPDQSSHQSSRYYKPFKKRYKQKAHQVSDPQQDSDSDHVFKLHSEGHHTSQTPMVSVRLNGVKGKMDADSCATANIIDEVTLSKIQAKLTRKIELKPATTNLYAYAQQKPIDLVGCFDALIGNARTGQETTAEFQVVKGKTTW